MTTKAKVVYLLFLVVGFYTQAGIPTIMSFWPTACTIGTSAIIAGTGFSPRPTDNIVYFGDVKAKVNTSTTTSISVTVPAGAGSVMPVSVTKGGLTAYSTVSTSQQLP